VGQVRPKASQSVGKSKSGTTGRATLGWPAPLARPRASRAPIFDSVAVRGGAGMAPMLISSDAPIGVLCVRRVRPVQQ
jgi:hypothetical protein